MKKIFLLFLSMLLLSLSSSFVLAQSTYNFPTWEEMKKIGITNTVPTYWATDYNSESYKLSMASGAYKRSEKDLILDVKSQFIDKENGKPNSRIYSSLLTIPNYYQMNAIERYEVFNQLKLPLFIALPITTEITSSSQKYTFTDDMERLSQFKDVENHWSKPYLYYFTHHQIMNGYPDRTMKPDQEVTRGEFFKILAISFFVIDESEAVNQHWAEKYMLTLKEKGMLGTDYTVEQLDQPVNRGEVAKILGEYLLKQEVEWIDSSIIFPDVEQEQIKQVIPVLSAKGIISGYPDGNFYSEKTVTRAELAKMIYRTLWSKVGIT